METRVTRITCWGGLLIVGWLWWFNGVSVSLDQSIVRCAVVATVAILAIASARGDRALRAIALLLRQGVRAEVAASANNEGEDRSLTIDEHNGQSSPMKASRCSESTGRVLVIFLMILHGSLLTWCAVRNSFCWTEAGLLPSGITDWHYADFSSYRVNPPLLRMWATLPIAAFDIDIPHYGATTDPRHRPEWDLAQAMFEIYGTRTWGWLTIGRIMCIPIGLGGMWIAVRWAGELFGREASVGTAVLWTFSPWMLGYGCLMSGDAQSAAMGVVVLYSFRRWVKNACLESSWVLGVAAGIAVLIKFSWLILFGLLPLIWILSRSAKFLQHTYRTGKWAPSAPIFREASLGMVAVVVCVLVINLAYGGKGSCTPLGEFNFISKALAGTDGWRPYFFCGNRFHDSWTGEIRIPLPEDMVIGVDLQKWDFDRERWSYLGGDWQNHGWWYYYLVGLAVKSPIGTLVLLFIAVAGGILCRSWRESSEDTLILCVPVLLILLLASAENGLNRHARYVLPVVPLLIILTSRVFLVFRSNSPDLRWLVTCPLTWTVLSSLWIYPHSHSYFNEFVGGPLNGGSCLNASNLDWGQDLKALHGWCERNPDKRPVFVSSYPSVPRPYNLQIPTSGSVPAALPSGGGSLAGSYNTPDLQTGWYVIDVEHLIRLQEDYRYLKDFAVDEHIGYGLQVFQVTEDTRPSVGRKLFGGD